MDGSNAGTRNRDRRDHLHAGRHPLTEHGVAGARLLRFDEVVGLVRIATSPGRSPQMEQKPASSLA